MQLVATPARSAVATPTVLASQSIDNIAHAQLGGGAAMWSTERQFRLAGAREGLDTYASAYDAVAAARILSEGEMPGLAVVRFRGGFRVHDVHTSSRTYWSSSTHGPMPPLTRLTRSSSVPFAAGNVRTDMANHRNSPAVVRAEQLVALVDGERAFVPSTDASWAGKQRLVERAVDEFHHA